MPPDAWPTAARADFEKYIDEARGSYLVLNADTATTWKWYTDFYRHGYAKRARNVFYKREAPLGYMPRAVSDVAATEQAVKWLLRQ